MLEESSRQYTDFKTPAGLFQFTVTLFDLHGAPATFQRLMDKVLQGCDHCSAAYLHDMVIYSDSWAGHIKHLTLVLGKIQKAGMTLTSQSVFESNKRPGTYVICLAEARSDCRWTRLQLSKSAFDHGPRRWYGRSWDSLVGTDGLCLSLQQLQPHSPL